MRFTIFTPTYNRRHTILKLYHSLQTQTFKNFEWVVVDDGSLDNTEDLFSEIKQHNNFFDIKYIKTKNGGKHRAINLGLSYANGELFYIVDSDDYLLPDSLAIADKIERSIPDNLKIEFAGICGIKGFDNKTHIGSTFDGEYLDITSLDRPKYNIQGDKAEIFYTDILKKYPFPEFTNENFLTENIVWEKIAFDGYKLRFFNEIIMICEYRSDGLTAMGHALFINNPKGYGLLLHQNASFGKIRGISKWTVFLQYYYQFRERLKFKEIANNLHFNSFILWNRLFFLRLFYRFYDD